MLTDRESWRWVIYKGNSYKGFYKVSNKGQVKSVARKIIGKTRHGKQIRIHKSRILKPFSHRGYLGLTLWINGNRKDVYVHHLVLEAFISSRPLGMECCHQNNVKSDNRLGNLSWGTHKNNIEDSYKTGCYQNRIFRNGNYSTYYKNKGKSIGDR